MGMLIRYGWCLVILMLYCRGLLGCWVSWVRMGCFGLSCFWLKISLSMWLMVMMLRLLVGFLLILIC